MIDKRTQGKTMLNRLFKALLPLIALSIMIGCGGGGGGGVKELGTGATYGTLTGIIRDTNNRIIADASITVGGKTFKTNAQGYFAFDEIAENPGAVVLVQKDGFVKKAEISTIKRGLNDHVEITLSPYAYSGTVNASAPINVQRSGAFVVIPANGLVNAQNQAIAGMVKINITPFDPTNEEDVKAFPGDFVGVRSDGTSGPLQSFGFLAISATDMNGSDLRLASGVKAKIGIPIPVSQQSTAQPTIPLWRFNTSNAQWEEEGLLTRNGNVYESEVTSFGTWNADVLYESAYITGKLMNKETNQSITCGRIVIKSPQNTGWESEERCTNDDGTFKLAAMPNTQAVLYGTKNGAVSEIYTIDTPAANKTLDMGIIYVKNPKIRITLTWGENPRDLDSHLTFDGENGREMVYYSNKSSSFDSVQLDTDDTSSYGPEITTIATVRNGTYRYSVHHYSGDGNITASQAILNMVVDQEGDGNTQIHRLEPAAGAIGNNDVWLAWDIKVENGNITNINPLQTYLHNIAASDIEAFSPEYNATK